jgi:O-antigen/teichoic acid export membrane protein
LKAGSQNIESLIIGFFVNAHAVGIYQTLRKLISPIAIIVQPLALLSYPRMIQYFEDKSVTKFQRLIIKISGFVIVFATIYSIIVTQMLEIILDIMSVQFDQIYYIYFSLMCLTMIFAAFQWWARPFSCTVNPMFSLYVNFFNTLYQAVVVVLCGYMWGLVGIITALCVLQFCLAMTWSYLGKLYVNKYQAS